METATPEINLLPQAEIEKAPLGKFLAWALTAGRYIVVITELIVLLAFLSRFKLDRDLTDLSEDIARKKSIISASAPFENKVRKLQDKLQNIDKLTASILMPEKYLPILTTALPEESVIDSVNLDVNRLTLTGTVKSEGGIQTIITELEKNPQIKNIAVNKLEQAEDGKTLNFSVAATLWP